MAKNSEKFYMGNHNLPSKGTVIAYTPEQAKEMEKCAKNIIHFAENYFYILNIDEGKTLIKLYKAQKRVLKKMMENNRSFTLFILVNFILLICFSVSEAKNFIYFAF